MARRTEEVTITADGRDKGKVFLITEMPALRAEKWAQRALLALVRGGGANISDDIAAQGFAGLAYLGVSALGALQYADLEPLMDEMLSECLAFYPGYPDTRIMRRFKPGIDDLDIEEVATILYLRTKIIELHMGFSLASALSNLTARVGATTTAGDTPATRTSPPPLASSSQAA